MAKKEKNITNAKDADLKQEKIQRVSFKQFIKDERTHKITGSLFVLLAVLLFVSFTSYLSTWDEDQDKLISEGSKLFWGTDTEVANLMGTFGAFVAHLFMFKGFGVASYLFCGFFFVIGVNLIFSKSVFSVVRNLRYLIVGLPLFSITASALFAKNPFPWGGAVGDLSKQWLFKVIGTFGTFAFIFIAFWAYIIWRFNPSINKLMQGRKNKAEDVDIVPAEETPEPVKPKKDKKEDAI
jgi:S-DNA-T family DNA segregation ATPase FtsK/SpoIIIE